MEYNLICAAGHRHWAKNPAAFVGETCHATVEVGAKKESFGDLEVYTTGAVSNCKEKLILLR